MLGLSVALMSDVTGIVNKKQHAHFPHSTYDRGLQILEDVE